MFLWWIVDNIAIYVLQSSPSISNRQISFTAESMPLVIFNALYTLPEPPPPIIFLRNQIISNNTIFPNFQQQRNIMHNRGLRLLIFLKLSFNRLLIKDNFNRMINWYEILLIILSIVFIRLFSLWIL